MKDEKIAAAEAEAKRFLKRVKEYKERIKADKYAIYGSREGGALKRSSLDLSRSLADMRRP
jgi:hypothetical protein